jgi:hypothetical protein
MRSLIDLILSWFVRPAPAYVPVRPRRPASRRD